MKLTIEAALVLLKQGKRIRRAYWPKGVFIVKGRMPYDEEDGVLKVWADENGVTEPTDYLCVEPFFWSGDIFKDDWEVIE